MEQEGEEGVERVVNKLLWECSDGLTCDLCGTWSVPCGPIGVPLTLNPEP